MVYLVDCPFCSVQFKADPEKEVDTDQRMFAHVAAAHGRELARLRLGAAREREREES